MNWWLVTRHIKHGMVTVRAQAAAGHQGHAGGHEATAMAEKPSVAALAGMAVLSIGIFVLSLIIVSLVSSP